MKPWRNPTQKPAGVSLNFDPGPGIYFSRFFNQFGASFIESPDIVNRMNYFVFKDGNYQNILM